MSKEPKGVRKAEAAAFEVQDGISALAAGDETRFASLFLLLAPRLKAYFLRQGVASTAADDLVQETMLRIWRKADHFDPASGNGIGWVFRIARNLRIDESRRGRTPRIEIAPPEPSSDSATPEELILSREQETQFKVALSELTPIQAEVLQRALIRKNTLVDVAQDLNLPLSTTKSHLRRAISQIRARLALKL